MSKARNLLLSSVCVSLVTSFGFSGAANAKPYLGIINPVVLEVYFSWASYFNGGSGGNGVVYAKNVTSVTDPKNNGAFGSGYWCIAPTNPLPNPYYVTVTPEFSGSYDTGFIATWDAAASDCPAGNIEIITGEPANPGNFNLYISSGLGFVAIVDQ